MASNEYVGKADLLYIFELIKNQFSGYVKGDGFRGLSENDFTKELKEKLEGIDLSKYATGTDADLKGTPKATTAADGDSSTRIATTEFVANAILLALKDIAGISFQKLSAKSELPKKGDNGVIYLVPISGSGDNTYTEYFWDGEKYEVMGSTDVDLTGYLLKDDVSELDTSEIKAAWFSVFGV